MSRAAYSLRMPTRAATGRDAGSSPTSLAGLGPEVGALLDAARDLASTLELRPLLEVLLDHLKRLVDYASTSIWQLEGDELAFLGVRGPSAECLGSTLHMESSPGTGTRVRVEAPR